MHMAELVVSLSSPPDRTNLVADIMINSVQVAEVNVESGRLEIEIYPNPNEEIWKLTLDDFLRALLESKRRLEERYLCNGAFVIEQD